MPIEDGFEQEIAEGLGVSEERASWGSALADLERSQRERDLDVQMAQLQQLLEAHRIQQAQTATSSNITIGRTDPYWSTTTTPNVPLGTVSITPGVTQGRVTISPLPNTIINPPGQWTILPQQYQDPLLGFKAEDLADLQALMQEFKVSEFRDILLMLRKALGSKYYNQRKSKVSKQSSLGLILD